MSGWHAYPYPNGGETGASISDNGNITFPHRCFQPHNAIKGYTAKCGSVIGK
jgi:hypothetical protein